MSPIKIELIDDKLFFHDPAWLTALGGILVLAVSAYGIWSQICIANKSIKYQAKQTLRDKITSTLSSFLHYSGLQNDLYLRGMQTLNDLRQTPTGVTAQKLAEEEILLEAQWRDATRKASEHALLLTLLLDESIPEQKALEDKLGEWGPICHEWETFAETTPEDEQKRILLLNKGLAVRHAIIAAGREVVKLDF